MYQKISLGMAELRKVADAAQAYASAKQWVVTIAIVDDGGHLQWLQRADGAPPATAYIATAKARTAAMGQRESKFYEDMVNAGRQAFLTAPGLDCLLEGGVPIMVNGSCTGAIGVSGVRSNEDVEIARAGIAALA
ncbi:heme-degrading [compost metagenome]